jgi:hypothetical protein
LLAQVDFSGRALDHPLGGSRLFARMGLGSDQQ